MKEFVKRLLGEQVHIEPYETNVDGYHLCLMKMQDKTFLLAEPLNDMKMTELRGQRGQLEYATGLRCVLYLKELSYYAKDRFLAEEIPFIWQDRQIYLPFLGISLQGQEERALRPCHQISFLTQKLLLTALYENWKAVSVSAAAGKLGVTKMSVSRVYDELEVLEIPYLQKDARTRLFTCFGSKKEMWENMLPHLRNPLLYQYELPEEVEELEIVSGRSALQYYLGQEGKNKILAVTKKELNRFQLEKGKCVRRGEIPACIVQELGYIVPFGDKKAVDPLSVALLLEKERKKDPQIGLLIDEMLEKYVWDNEKPYQRYNIMRIY